MARVFPNLFATHRVRAVDDYSAHLLRALRNSRPPTSRSTVVVLTPGVANSAYFEHYCWPGRWRRAGRGPTCSAATTRCTCAPPTGTSVDVIYRRIDDAFLDRCSSARLGARVAVWSTPPAGTSSSPVRSATASRRQARLYLRADHDRVLPRRKPLLANVDTYRCWLDDEREECSTGSTNWSSSRSRIRRLRHRVRSRRLRQELATVAKKIRDDHEAGSPSR